MDYLFYSLGTTGDALPFIKLAARLNAIGARSGFIGNERFATMAAAMDVPFYSVSTKAAYDNTYNNPLTWSSHHSQNHYNEFHFPAMKPTFQTIKNWV